MTQMNILLTYVSYVKLFHIASFILTQNTINNELLSSTKAKPIKQLYEANKAN